MTLAFLALLGAPYIYIYDISSLRVNKSVRLPWRHPPATQIFQVCYWFKLRVTLRTCEVWVFKKGVSAPCTSHLWNGAALLPSPQQGGMSRYSSVIELSGYGAGRPTFNFHQRKIYCSLLLRPWPWWSFPPGVKRPLNANSYSPSWVMRGTMHVGMPTAPVRLHAMVLGHTRHSCLHTS